MPDRLDELIRRELSERMLGRIEATVREASLIPAIARREFHGNEFDLQLDFHGRVAIVSDVVFGDEDLTLPLDRFLERVGLRADLFARRVLVPPEGDP